MGLSLLVCISPLWTHTDWKFGTLLTPEGDICFRHVYLVSDHNLNWMDVIISEHCLVFITTYLFVYNL